MRVTIFGATAESTTSVGISEYRMSPMYAAILIPTTSLAPGSTRNMASATSTNPSCIVTNDANGIAEDAPAEYPLLCRCQI